MVILYTNHERVRIKANLMQIAVGCIGSEREPLNKCRMDILYTIVICNVSRNTPTIAGMQWKIENSVSYVFALSMASYAMYDRMCHASHANLIKHNASADTAAS